MMRWWKLAKGKFMVSVAKPKIADRPLIGAKVASNPQPKKIAAGKVGAETQSAKATRKAAIRARRSAR